MASNNTQTFYEQQVLWVLYFHSLVNSILIKVHLSVVTAQKMRKLKLRVLSCPSKRIKTYSHLFVFQFHLQPFKLGVLILIHSPTVYNRIFIKRKEQGEGLRTAIFKPFTGVVGRFLPNLLTFLNGYNKTCFQLVKPQISSDFKALLVFYCFPKS